MCIRELNDQFEIQGAFCIKAWKEEALDCIVLASGSDFECDRWDIEENILERKISYMYAVDGVLNIELEWD
jgi:hypothetical protein